MSNAQTPALAGLPTGLVVTGAAHGIGAEVAVAAAAAGSSVILADIDERGVSALAQRIQSTGGKAFPAAVDVTRRDSVDQLFQDAVGLLGRVDGVVNSAGGFPRTRAVEDLEDDEWRRVVDLNLFGTFASCRAAFGVMRNTGGGAIVNVASEAGRMPGWLTGVHYVAAKSAVIGMTKHLALEGGPIGIRVNAVAPGTTMTDRVRSLYSEEKMARLVQMTPMGRLAELSDQVSPILFLLSDNAAYMTGTTLDVNGGRLML